MNEIWKQVIGAEGIYEISSFGNIRSVTRNIIHPKSGRQIIMGKAMRPTLGKKGYFYVSICINGKIKKKYIHQLVCEAFIGPRPSGVHIDHIDHDRTNNAIFNLRYASAALNCGFPGSEHPNSKLNERQVKEIRSKYVPRIYTLKMLGDEYGVDVSCIGHIIKRKLWNHI